jgi:protein SCO1
VHTHIIELMKRKPVIYFLFFSILVIAFLAILTKLIPEFANPKAPVMSNVEAFSFINQDGKTFTEKDVEGKVYVAEFFFTTCKGICPKLNNNLRTVYNVFQNQPDFLILSHTCDPETDSVSTLKHYADSMQVDTRKWVFLTGRKDSLYRQARVSYKIDDPENNLTSIEDDFLHTQFFALVNKKAEVIKIYDGLKESEVKMMISDIEKLIKE